MSTEDKGLRERVTRQSEETIGKLAQDLLENPMVSSALSAAFQSRERAMRAQEVAMGALNLPSASDLERLTRRLRGVSQRLEGIEDALDGVQDRIESLGTVRGLDERLGGIEETLQRIEAQLASSNGAGSGSRPRTRSGSRSSGSAGASGSGPRPGSAARASIDDPAADKAD
jgi:chromosome segregation ATPase